MVLNCNSNNSTSKSNINREKCSQTRNADINERQINAECGPV